MRKPIALLIAILTITLLTIPAALAQDEDPPADGEVSDDEVNEIARQLYCPVCENIPLDVCETKACADWRAEIRTMLGQGQTEADIKAYFAERYGKRVLATPEREGIDLVIWLAPPIIVVIGLIIFFFTLRRMLPGAATAQPQPAAAGISYDGLDSEYVARLEQELREYE